MENHWGFVFCLRVTNLTLTSLSGAWLLIKLGEINLNKNDTIFTRDRWTQSEFTQVRLTHRKQLILTNLTQRHRNERGCCTLKGNRVPLHPSARGALMLRPRRTPGEHQPRAPKHRFLKLAVKNGPGAEERPPSLPPYRRSGGPTIPRRRPEPSPPAPTAARPPWRFRLLWCHRHAAFRVQLECQTIPIKSSVILMYI